MKKIIALVLCVLLISALAVTAFAADENKITATASKTEVKPGDTVTITVSIASVDKFTSFGYTVAKNAAFDVAGTEEDGEMLYGTISNTVLMSAPILSALDQDGLALAYTKNTGLNGDLCTFEIKIKADAPAGTYSVISGVSAKNKAGEVVEFALSAPSITIVCEHSYGAWTEDGTGHKQTCSKCGDVKTAGHSWDAGKVTKEPDCKNDGVKTFTCADCGATKTEAVAATGKHNYTGATNVDATNHELTCSGCGDKKTEAHKWDAGKVTTEPTCKDAGVKTFTCTACAATKTEVVPATGNHNFVNPVKVDQDTHKLTCGCGEEKTEAHTWDAGKVTTEPTCKDAGEKTFTCTACAATKTEAVAKTDDHKFGDWTAVEGKDEHVKTCSVCDKKETAAHAWGEGEVTKEPTCKDTGVETFKCADCAATKEEVLPVTEDHVSEEWTSVDGETHKGTCSVCAKEVTVEHFYYPEFTETEHWGVCVCGDKMEAEAHEMVWDFNDKLHVQYCDAMCGYHTEVVEHKWDEGTVTKKPTTTAEGEKTFKCECGATKTEAVAKITTPATGDNNANVALVVLAVLATCGLALTVIGKKRFAR